MHSIVDRVVSLFKREGRRSVQEGTAYEAVEAEDLDGDLQRPQSRDVPMREISRQ